MEPIENFSVRLSIDSLNAEFAWCLDHENYEGLDDLFCDDATYTSGTRVLRGRDEIRSFFQQRAAIGKRSTRHMFSGVRIEQHGGLVRATSVWMSFAVNGPVPADEVPVYMVADFFDTYKKGPDDKWRILERRIAGVFRNPDAAPRT
ncbi:nuclear transport factor 2 family protein [Paraburkholderia sp.]|uniref:nuclear transport factor 2 family protein n=1 Tax=Paraburkholderia sp. TaxID=1926495 RepID=UPI003C7BE7F8